jgi:hypothetical protein
MKRKKERRNLMEKTVTDKRVGVESGIYDNLTLDCFRGCPQYYEWRIEKGLIKSGGNRIDLDFGIAVHNALETYYKTGMTDQSIADAIEGFIEEFSPKQIPEEEKKTLQKGIEVLIQYYGTYRREPFNVVETEVGFTIEIGGYLYSGRIDLIEERFSPKGIEGMDHKTSSALHRMITKPHNAITGYLLALHEHYENVTGFVLNAIGIYQTDKKINKATGQKEEREILVRMPTSRTPHELETWKEEVIQLIHLIETCSQNKNFPKTAPNQCLAFRGCPYRDLCIAQDKEIYLPLVEGGVYEVSHWKPFEEIGEGGDET